MAATTDLEPQSQFLEEQFKEAWKLFKADAFDKANELSRWLLMEPSLSNLHKAGLHLILAHSPDEYVYHAKEAVRLYQSLYTPDEEQTITTNQKKSRDTLLAGAQRVLRECEADEGVITARQKLDPYTEEDLKEDLEAAAGEWEAHQERMEAEADAEFEDSKNEDAEMTGIEEFEFEEEHEDNTPLLPTPPVSRGNAA